MDIRSIIVAVYASFNRRDIDGTLALMSADVRWPKASEGGSVVGHAAICEYWTRQWAEFDPFVDVLGIAERSDGKIVVSVRQRVKSLAGELLSDTTVSHVYTFVDGLIARMDIADGDGAASDAPSAAFATNPNHGTSGRRSDDR